MGVIMKLDSWRAVHSLRKTSQGCRCWQDYIIKSNNICSYGINMKFEFKILQVGKQNSIFICQKICAVPNKVTIIIIHNVGVHV